MFSDALATCHRDTMREVSWYGDCARAGLVYQYGESGPYFVKLSCPPGLTADYDGFEISRTKLELAIASIEGFRKRTGLIPVVTSLAEIATPAEVQHD